MFVAEDLLEEIVPALHALATAVAAHLRAHPNAQLSVHEQGVLDVLHAPAPALLKRRAPRHHRAQRARDTDPPRASDLPHVPAAPASPESHGTEPHRADAPGSGHLAAAVVSLPPVSHRLESGGSDARPGAAPAHQCGPAAVAGLSLRGASGGSVVLEWKAAGPGVTFNVYRGVDGGSMRPLVAGLDRAAFQDATAQRGHTYRYYVTAQNQAHLESGPSPLASVR